MKIRIAIATALLGLAAACSSATDPLMACQGNPKCKADTSPRPPSTLQPLQPAGSSGQAVER
jgi:hypothetical protein